MSASPSPFPDDFGPTDQSLIEAFSEVEHFVLDLEPKVREVNRVLVPLFGRCSTSEDGSWAFITKDDSGQYFVALEPIPVEKALQLVARLAEVNAILDDSETLTHSRSNYQADLGPSIVGDAARLNYVPSTHVRVVHK